MVVRVICQLIYVDLVDTTENKHRRWPLHCQSKRKYLTLNYMLQTHYLEIN